MGALFGGGNKNNSAMMAQQMEFQNKQMAIQQTQQDRLDAQEREQKASLVAKQRAARFGGARALMSGASLSDTTATGQQTLGVSG